MKRNLYAQLLSWKERQERKPLVLSGARQVGKTWLLKEFGKREYENTVYVNCDKNVRIQEIFSLGYDIPAIIRNLGAITDEEIIPGKTLIIFDEIQEMPTVLTSLKYFAENAPAYHVAAAGSLLGLSFHSGTGFPVGKVDMLELQPLSFFEFIRAVKGERFFDLLSKAPLEETRMVHQECISLLRDYYFVGGMPEAVVAYAAQKSFREIRMIQDALLYAYGRDMSKHAEERDIPRIHQVWNSIPSQLAKENKRFVYGAIRKGSRAKEYETAIQWLIDAGLVSKVSRIRKPCIPLKFYEDIEVFKLFMVDAGLMGALSETPVERIAGGDSIFQEYKGAFSEQYVFQQLKAEEASIWYYSADDSKQEIDFLLQQGMGMIPVEVKAVENLRSKSMRQFVIDHPKTKGIRLSLSPYREEAWMTNIPLYLASRISDSSCIL